MHECDVNMTLSYPRYDISMDPFHQNQDFRLTFIWMDKGKCPVSGHHFFEFFPSF